MADEMARRSSGRPLQILAALFVLAVLVSGVGPAQSAEQQPTAPRVVASIMPLHSLVAGVMQGVGQPHLLIRGAASPHNLSLRPSDAAALERADLVFWIGPSLETFLERPLHGLAADARVIALSRLAGLRLLPQRENAVWGGQDPREEDQDHDHGHDHGHGHDHASEDRGAFNSHLWLDPGNAMLMVSAIAESLAEVDPARAVLYRANSAAVIAGLQALDRELEARLAPLAGRPYAVVHDAFHYLEARYGLSPVGAIAISPDRRPGARRLFEIRRAIRDNGALCVFAEPQFEPKLIDNVIADTAARSAVLDPLGAGLEPGPAAYGDLLRGNAAALENCLGQDDGTPQAPAVSSGDG